MLLDLTFVVPCLNEEALIARCIRSIRSEAPGSQIIVVDNGSTDRSVDIAMSLPGVIVLHESRRGLTQARQSGHLMANTKWVAHIDADNELPDGWLIAAYKAINSGKGKRVVAVSGPPMFKELLVLARGMVFAFYCIGRICHTMMPMLQGGNFIVDRQALLDAGGFDLNVDFYGEDTATAKRLATQGILKFDLDLFCYSSARRIAAEGLVLIGLRYTLNYLWMSIVGKPFTKTHNDHRDATT
jgi:glycosyltransferase involved in cell wall biosynthesis